jgi:chromosomal replication initiation ATPase DnaA
MNYWVFVGLSDQAKDSCSGRAMNDEDKLMYLLNATSRTFGVKQIDMISRRGGPHVCDARHGLYFLVRKNTRLSLKEMGRRLKKNHSTIQKSIMRAIDIMSVDNSYKKIIDQIQSEFDKEQKQF